MRQLCGNLNPVVAERRQRPLPLQRLRPLLQDEWYKSSSGQTKTQNGESITIQLEQYANGQAAKSKQWKNSRGFLCWLGWGVCFCRFRDDVTFEKTFYRIEENLEISSIR